MNATASKYRFTLDRSSKKFRCPECGKMRFVKYIDSNTNEYLSDSVGRCDREHNCGYHITPKEFFEKKGISYEMKTQKPAPKPRIDFITLQFLEGSMSWTAWKGNRFGHYLNYLFGESVTERLRIKYLLGTSKLWPGACVFWQIDDQERVRQGKIVLYDAITGKRIKNHVQFAGKKLSGDTANFELCFFGQHLLKEYPDKKVCIVESEKTAVIASVYFPEFIWLAAGGASGCKWREYSVYKCLKNRHVTFFPDYGMYKPDKTCYQEWTERVQRIKDAIPGTFKVSDLLEKKLADNERQDQDLADILVRRNVAQSLCESENNLE